MFKINESTGDAMQALGKVIPKGVKIEYLNSLFKVGFNIIDLGYIASPHTLPHMQDTPDILKSIREKFDTQISLSVRNSKNAEQVSDYDIVDVIGFSFALSETYIKKILNSNFEDSFNTIERIINLCIKKNKKHNITISTAFGNPYEDDWGIDIIMELMEIFYEMGLQNFTLEDTIGSGSPHLIGLTFKNLIDEYPDCEFSLHLHSGQNDTIEKIESAYLSGCMCLESTIKGYGGCKLPGYELNSNTDSVKLIEWLDSKKIEHGIKKGFFNDAVKKAFEIFPK